MVTVNLEPVNRESTPGIVARQLREAIMAGDLAPGAQLREAELAAQLAVSRGPLREAMQRLVQEGLLRSERNRGLFVVELEPADVYDIYTARTAIEQAAARLVLRGDPRAVARQLAAVHRELKEAVEAGDQRAAGRADVRFHQVLVGAAGSPRLSRMAGTLLIETAMCIAALQRTYQVPRHQVSEHGAILRAVRNGDEALLLGLIESHMEDGLQRLAPGWSLRGPAPVRLVDTD